MIELAAFFFLLPFVGLLLIGAVYVGALIVAVLRVIPDFLFYWPNKLLKRS